MALTALGLNVMKVLDFSNEKAVKVITEGWWIYSCFLLVYAFCTKGLLRTSSTSNAEK
jgi:hypothetical protein